MIHLVADVSRCVIAVILFPLFLIVPGYVVAYHLNLFQFRQMGTLWRAVAALPLSIGIAPIFVYLAWRSLGIGAVWCLMALVWVTFAHIVIVDRGGRRQRVPRPVLWMMLGWAVISIAVQVDIPWGHRLYVSSLICDHGFRTAVIDAFSRTAKLPAANPFFFPGHEVPFRYHYFWFMLSSLVDRVGGRLVDARAALVGSVVWAGFAVLAMIALMVRVFEGLEGTAAKRRMLWVAAIACVSGFDIIPVAGEAIANLLAHQAAWVPSATIDWWNGTGQITSWITTALWVPNHAGGFVACMVGTLLLWDGRRREKNGQRLACAIAAGFCFASAAGLSIFVAFIFGIFLAAIAMMFYARGQKALLLLAVFAGVIAVSLAVPYLLELRTGNENRDAFLVIGVRGFSWTNALKGSVANTAGKQVAFETAMLPVNYFFELGVLLPIAIWKLRRIWRERKQGDERDIVMAMMFFVPLVLTSFLRFPNADDFGWRGWLIGQFALLFWAADFVTEKFASRERSFAWLRPFSAVNAFIAAGLAVGVLTNVAELVLLRTYMIGAEQGWAVKDDWVVPNSAEEIYDLRQSLEWLDSNVPRAAIIQENPNVSDATFQGYYSHRQTAARGWHFGPAYGGDRIQYAMLAANLRTLFKAASTVRHLMYECGTSGVDVVVMHDYDPAWAWASANWENQMMYATPHTRLFACSAKYSLPQDVSALRVRSKSVPVFEQLATPNSRAQ